MKQVVNLKNQKINQTVSKKNIFRILLFIFFALFLIILTIYAIFLVKSTNANYIGKTPFDPEKTKVGDTVFDMKVVDISTNKYGYTKVHLFPKTEGSGDFFFFNKEKKVVCEGLPCCYEGSKGNDAIWQDEWCLGY